MLSPFRLFGLFISTCLLAFHLAATAAETEIKLKAQLVWGTDDSSAPPQGYQALSSTLRDKIRHLRWKNYFVVKATPSGPTKPGKPVELSDRCHLSIKDLANGFVEVSIYNPKSNKPTEPVRTEKLALDKLKKGDVMVFAGESKDRWDDAWLVFITIGD